MISNQSLSYQGSQKSFCIPKQSLLVIMPPIIQKSLLKNVQRSTTFWILVPHYSHDGSLKNFVSWSDIAWLPGARWWPHVNTETYAVSSAQRQRCILLFHEISVNKESFHTWCLPFCPVFFFSSALNYSFIIKCSQS